MATDTFFVDTTHPLGIYRYIIPDARLYAFIDPKALVPDIDPVSASNIFLAIRKFQMAKLASYMIISKVLRAFDYLSRQLVAKFLMVYLLNYEGVDDNLREDVYVTLPYTSVDMACDSFWSHLRFRSIPANFLRYPITEFSISNMARRYKEAMDRFIRDSVETPSNRNWVVIPCISQLEVLSVEGQFYEISPIDAKDLFNCLIELENALLITDGVYYIIADKIKNDVVYHVAHPSLPALYEIYQEEDFNKRWHQINHISGSERPVLDKLLNRLGKNLTVLAEEKCICVKQQ